MKSVVSPDAGTRLAGTRTGVKRPFAVDRIGPSKFTPGIAVITPGGTWIATQTGAVGGSFPAWPARGLTPAAGERSEMCGAKVKLAINDVTGREQVARLLRDAGFEVVMCGHNGRETTAAETRGVAAQVIDVSHLDRLMIEKTEAFDAVTIVATPPEHIKSVIEAVKCGAVDDYACTPLVPDDVLIKLKRLLTLAALQRNSTSANPGFHRHAVPANPSDAAASTDLRTALRTFEAEHIRRVLSLTGWNKVEAARQLGIGLSSLYRKLDELDIGKERRTTERTA